MQKFIELGLSRPTVLGLQELGYIEPTEIQAQTIPVILAGRDVLGSAQTGSGKTAAFALPVVECLQDAEHRPRALVLAPTRELALQVEEQFDLFGKHWKLRTVTLYGGTGYEAQLKALRRGVDIIVATPGRLLDHMQRRTVDISKIEIVVLDEADRLLDMGFMPQVRRIISQLSKQRQTLMFSATLGGNIQRIASDFMIDPVTVESSRQRLDPVEIEQRFYHVNEFGKDALLAQLIKEQEVTSALVFTRTKRRTEWVKSRLREANIAAEEIHGDLSQNQRERTLSRYRDGEFMVLVATDVAARGLDIPSISHVINYDLPESPEDYVHRIGRTGRAGRAGAALSFVAEYQNYLVRDIEKKIGRVLDPDSQIKRMQSPRLRSRGRRRIV